MVKKRHGIGLLITLASVLVALMLQAVGVFKHLNHQVYDFSFQMRGPLAGWASRQEYPPDSLDVVLIDIDDETYRLIQGWPYPRGKIWNRLVRNLTDAGASVIAFDVQFDSRDSYTTKVLEWFGDQVPPGFQDGDVAFAEAIEYARERGTEVVLASTIKMEPTRIPPQLLITPNKYIMQANPELGLVDDYLDEDGFTRRYPIFGVMRHKPDKWHLSIGIKTIAEYLDIPLSDKIYYDYQERQFQLGDLAIPSYGSSSQFFLINWYGPASAARLSESSDPWATFCRYPFSNVLDTEDFDLADEDTDWMSLFTPNSSINRMLSMLNPAYKPPVSPFKDKICIVGISVEVKHDYNKSPFYSYFGKTSLLPGFEYHANAIQTVLDGNYIKVLGGTLEFTAESALTYLWLTLVCGLLTYLLIGFLEPLWGGVLIGLEIFIFVSISIGLFTNDVLWLVKMVIGQSDKINIPAVGRSVVVPVIMPLAAILLS